MLSGVMPLLGGLCGGPARFYNALGAAAVCPMAGRETGSEQLAYSLQCYLVGPVLAVGQA